MQNKVKINQTIYDVCTLEDYQHQEQNGTEYLPNYTAIIDGDYLYPVLNGSNNVGPGVLVGSQISIFRKPNPEQEEQYRRENMIRFDNVKDMATMIDRLDAVKKLESEVLTSVDNIFAPKIQPSDTPEMVALKTAVIKKHIDLDKYEPRFGSNYNNDKRLFNKQDISIKMMKRLANALDMDITLTITDAPNAPNPIGETIVVKLTDRNSVIESEDMEEYDE